MTNAPMLRTLAFAFLALGCIAGCSSLNTASLPFDRSDEQLNDPNTLAIVGGDVISRSEFETQYAKTSGGREAAADDSLEAFQDFLTRYVDYKLKVAAAKRAGMHQDSTILLEIESYRSNLARPYLLESEVLEPLTRELYDRQQEVIDVSHILVRVDGNAPPQDTLAAFNRMQAIRDSVGMGHDFGELAIRHSDDPSARVERQPIGYKGRLGYRKGGGLVKPFEDMMYATEIGDTSPVFRTRFGYHILIVHDRQVTQPDIEIAHIMIRPKGPTPEDTAQVMQTIAQIQERMTNGSTFEEMAQEFSEDASSSPRGGVLGRVSYDAILPTMRDAAFALENVGDVSDAVVTPFGIHLIKLLGRIEPQTYDEAYSDLKSTVTRLERGKAAERAFGEEVMTARGARVDTTLLMQLLDGIPNDSLRWAVQQGTFTLDNQEATPLAFMGDSTYVVGDLVSFAKRSPLDAEAERESQILGIMDQFLAEKAIVYEAAALEDRDPQFAQTMQDFRDGLVLFKLMEDSVWTAASADTAGLRAYYDARAETYRFSDRTRVISFTHSSDSLLNVVRNQFLNGTSIDDLHQSFGTDSVDAVRFDTTYIAEQTNSIYDNALNIAENALTMPISYRGSFIVLLNDGIAPARQKTFEEARTEALSAYQDLVEQEMLARLRDEYAVVEFPERLHRVFMEERLGDASPSAETED